MKARKQIKRYALYAILAALAVLFVIIKRDSFSSFIEQVSRILRPVIIGAVIAYLCNPIFRMFERLAFSGVRSFTVRRTLSLIGTYIVFAFVSCLFYDCFVQEVVTDWFAKSFQAPGLIFTFDLDGCLWLIGMKILFWAIGLVFGIVAGAIGIAIGLVCAPFVFPFVMKTLHKDYQAGRSTELIL